MDKIVKVEMKDYYSQRKIIQQLYVRDVAYGDIAGTLLGIREQDPNIESMSLEIQSFRIRIELVQGKNDEENYKKDEYPMFKYFILTKYKTQEDFVKRMNNNAKYPLINQLLQEIPGVKKLKCLPDFNDFTNYMIENYSFRISREEAKRRILKDEEICKNNIFLNILKILRNFFLNSMEVCYLKIYY